MKILYYVIEKEVIDINGIEECTGKKEITLYTIKNDVPTVYSIFKAPNESSTINEINDHLIEINSYDNFTQMVQL